jgi:Subtilase family
VAAPGDGIVSTLPTYDNGSGAINYGYLSGTSMAAPVVSGIAALIWPQATTATAGRDVEARLIRRGPADHGHRHRLPLRTGRRLPGLDRQCPAVWGACCSGTEPGAARPGSSADRPTGTHPLRDTSPQCGARRLHGVARARPRPSASGRGRRRRRADPARRHGATRLPRRRALRARVAALSTNMYGQIRRGGKVRLRTRIVSGGLRRSRLDLAGTFNAARGMSGGTLRLSGQAGAAGSRDSRVIRWSARLT